MRSICSLEARPAGHQVGLGRGSARPRRTRCAELGELVGQCLGGASASPAAAVDRGQLLVEVGRGVQSELQRLLGLARTLARAASHVVIGDDRVRRRWRGADARRCRTRDSCRRAGARRPWPRPDRRADVASRSSQRFACVERVAPPGRWLARTRCSTRASEPVALERGLGSGGELGLERVEVGQAGRRLAGGGQPLVETVRRSVHVLEGLRQLGSLLGRAAPPARRGRRDGAHDRGATARRRGGRHDRPPPHQVLVVTVELVDGRAVEMGRDTGEHVGGGRSASDDPSLLVGRASHGVAQRHQR